MTDTKEEWKLQVYPAPSEAVLQNDFMLKVRKAGADEDWVEVPIYQVKVDMHDVREASMAYFDFSGQVEVEITFPRYYCVYCVDIRPLSQKIHPQFEDKRITFVLDHPANLSIEVNRDRFHNLHLFAGSMEEIPSKEGKDVYLCKGDLQRPGFLGDSMNAQIEALPEGRMVYIEAGIHYIGEFLWHIPSHTKVYLEGGAILKGALVIDHAEDIQICGRGMLYLAKYERFSSTNGLRISHSNQITVENLMFVNPPHYTVCLGGSQNVFLKNLKSFSCEGWSDGIDLMSCQNVVVDGGFLRTSDDCVAIYGSRWDYRGDSRNIQVRNLTVWADVAHPLMIGTHGAYDADGDVIEQIEFDNIDILEHREPQSRYLGTMAINVGDKNVVREVSYKNIRIESIEHGKILDFQVIQNPDYNPAPGKGIEHVMLDHIEVMTGQDEVPSVIDGYDNHALVRDVIISDYRRDGKKAESVEEMNLRIGRNTERIVIKKD